MHHRFWLVCNPQRMADLPPKHMHPTYESAQVEAARLAREHPGQTFHVMASAAAVTKTELHWQTFNEEQTEHSPDVPF